MKPAHLLLVVVTASWQPLIVLGQPRAPQGQAQQGARANAVASPEINADGKVTFRLRAPGAREVTVTFGRSSGGPAPVPMTKNDEGVWSVTTSDPMPPDLYSYSFVVDGTRFPDPSNLSSTWASSPSGSQAATSALLIPGVPWTNTDVAHGAVAKHVYQSAIIGGPETYYVYTPPGYDPKRDRPYPVLVTIHGLGNDAQDWIVQAGANLTLDTLIGTGEAEPMILVSPSAYGNPEGRRGAAAGFPNFTNALLKEILPQVQKHYHASDKASERAVTGLSMGAAQSLLLLNHLDKFEWIGSFSPGFDMYSPKWGTGAIGPTVNGQRPALEPGELEAAFPNLDSDANSHIKLLYVSCGTADDHLMLTRQFKEFLEARKIRITHYSEPAGVEHVWSFWRQELAAFALLLFKSPAN